MAALSDMFAAASLGVYPTPTPSAAQRAIYAVSFGLLSIAPIATSGAQLGRMHGVTLTVRL